MVFSLFLSLTNARINPPGRTTATISSVCPKCGIAKSGKRSCCGRGGSWFKTCGGADNTRFRHTWYEGMHACKARRQSRTAVGQQENTVKQKRIGSSHGAATVNSKGVVITADNVSTSTSTINIETRTTTIPSASTSVTFQGYEGLLNIALRINLLAIIVFQY